ncbi:MAG: prolyl oligopeptidase family serine peptidase [Bacteroidota bacterium]
MSIRSIQFILTIALLLFQVGTGMAQKESTSNANTWQSPPEDILKVLHAPKLPRTSISPTGKHMVLSDPIVYPSLAELGAPMHKLAGMRVNPANNFYHGWHGGVSPRIVNINNGQITPLDLPEGAEVIGTEWTTDGQRFAMTVGFKDRMELWLGDITGKVEQVENVVLNALLGKEVSWLPDQQRLLIRRIPARGPVPQEPEIPVGPFVLEGDNASAKSTYEARNLLETAHDDELFSYFTLCELVIYDPENNATKVIGPPAIYDNAQVSPNGKYIMISRLQGPWSHEVAWWRFAKDIEVWDMTGKMVAKIASLPLADQVPVMGVPEGIRGVSWRPTAPHTLYWMEALDGGNPMAKASHRDKIMRQEAPFEGNPEEVFTAEHRIRSMYWGEENGVLMVAQRERIKRRRYMWLLDVDKGSSRLWFDFDEQDRYENPGYPVFEKKPNGQYVFRITDGSAYFRGQGGTKEGDRPFLDRRDLETGKAERLFRCEQGRYEYFVQFTGDEEHFVLSSESAADVPNYYLAEIGKKRKAEEGEGTRKLTRTPITKFEDPSPELRQITKRIVKYEREDGVPLSFQLLLPPGYKEGTKLPTVVYAYPLEYSSAQIAGQTRGSANRFMRLYGASHNYFLMRGYAVLDNTAMPMVGDPETVYDTFVPQLVADAEAAVKKAVEIGVADPDRIGIIGHSHGGLMVANLLAHTDLFCAGIARSGSYNKTNQPYGFQSERRSLFEARDAYIQVSPTFFADKVNEPVLIIHGNDDSNPGTLTFQSEVFYEAVRGSGGTTRLVLLPFEDHGYRARETVEHVIWEQLRWFDQYVKNREVK